MVQLQAAVNGILTFRTNHQMLFQHHHIANAGIDVIHIIIDTSKYKLGSNTDPADPLTQNILVWTGPTFN